MKRIIFFLITAILFGSITVTAGRVASVNTEINLQKPQTPPKPPKAPKVKKPPKAPKPKPAPKPKTPSKPPTPPKPGI